MPPGRKHLADALAKGREVLAQQKEAFASETVHNDLWGSLQIAKSQIGELEVALAQESAERQRLQSALEKSNQKCSQLQAEVSQWKLKHQSTYRDLRTQRQATKRGHNKLEILAEQISILKKVEADASTCLLNRSQDSEKALALLTKANEGLRSELSHLMAHWTMQLEKSRSKLDTSKSNLKALQQEVTALRKVSTRARAVTERGIASVKAKILQERSVHNLKEKGVYTNATRDIVRLLVKAGCSRNYIYTVISTILASAGIETIGSISRTSVARIIREGYIAAQIQLGHEMKNAESMTFSADGTSHRSINYNSRHVHLLAENYALPGGNTKQRATRFLGIQSSRDGSSEESVMDWEITLKKIIQLYNNSPFGKRSGSLVTFIDLLIKLMGMNSDHCSKEKKDARLLEELKAWAVNQSLGEEVMLEMPMDEIVQLFQKAESDMIKVAGGQQKWAALSDNAQAEERAVMLEEVVAELGKEAFGNLSDDEKRIFRLFIWAGCGCHKDLNTVKGGYMAMMRFWKERGLEGPVLLANRDNDPVVQERNTTIEQGDTPTPAQERAFDTSTRGAIKTAQIAGAIFNHKDDKKGHHDLFRYWWWEHVGTPFTFPDTSNNHFQAYCNAAAALVLHRHHFIAFLENLRVNKQNSKLNHMETNLWNALHCDSTISELAVLAIYAEAVSYPYMKAIRASGDNMLNLGPLHSHVYNHMQKIISDPNILIGQDISFAIATLDGEEWQNTAVVKKVLDLAPTLPHFQDLLVVFFEGAAETWKRFTSEFAPGGLIDEATVEERELAWMPATNDENEGALGSFRQLMRKQPQLTLLNHNALAMFFHNNTQAFMAAKFTEVEDHQYLHKLARETQGDEKKRKKEIVEYRDKRQAEKTAQKEKRNQNAKKTADRIAGLDLILDKKKIANLRGESLKDQLKLFKLAEAPNLIGVRQPTLVADIRKALSDAVDLHQSGEWLVGSEEESEGSDTEDEDEDDWEDED